MTALAEKYAKAPSQIALRFLVEKGMALIPSATTSVGRARTQRYTRARMHARAHG